MDNLENNLKNIKASPARDWQDKTRANLAKFAELNVTSSEESRNEVGRRSNFNLIFTYFNMNRKLLLAGGAFTFVLLAFVGTFVVYSLWSSYNNAKSVPINLSAAEKQQIFEGILKNNSTSSLNQNQRSATDQLTANAFSANAEDAKVAAGSTLTAESDMAPLPLLPYGPDVTQYNYRNTTSTTALGPAATQCRSLAYNFESPSGDRVTKWVNSEFYVDNESYYESSSFDEAGNLYRYNLSKYNSVQSEYYDYAGGKYAVKNTYVYPAAVGLNQSAGDSIEPSRPASDFAEPEAITTDDSVSPDVLEYIKSYFGPDVDIVEAVELSGRKYYVLQYSYDIDCNQDYYAPLISSRITTDFTPTNKAIIRNWVDSENFNIVKTLNYIDSAEDSKLVYSNETTLEQRNVAFAEVASIFDFDYPNVEVRETVTQGQSYEYNIENEINNTVEGIKSNSIPVLNLVKDGLQMNSIYFYDKDQYSSSQGYDYIYDRDFYPSDTRGQKMYDDAVQVLNDSKQYEYAISILSLNFGSIDSVDSYEYYSMSSYEKSEGMDKVLNSSKPYAGDGVNATEEIKQVDITIDGKVVAANYYSYRVDQQIYTLDAPMEKRLEESTSLIAPAPGDGTPTSYVYYTRFIIFEHGEFIHLLYLPGDEGYTLPDLRFDEFNPAIADDLEGIKSLVRETLTRVNVSIPVDPGIGDGSSGSGVACTMDAKICDDGSSVGRDPNNNCEFYACPGQ